MTMVTTTAIKLLFVVTLISCLSSSSLGFVPRYYSFARTTTSGVVVLNSNSNDEIAKLEAQLLQLKQQQQQQQQLEQEQKDSAKSSRPYVYEPMEEMMTEQWKSQEKDEDNASSIVSIPTIVASFMLIVGIIAASQIPVGQEELNTYASIPSGTSTQRIDLGDLNAARKTN